MSCSPPVGGTGCRGSLVFWKACPHNALSVHWERSTAGCNLRRRPSWPPWGPCPGTRARRRTRWSSSRCPRWCSHRSSWCPHPEVGSSCIYLLAPCCTDHLTLVLWLPEKFQMRGWCLLDVTVKCIALTWLSCCLTLYSSPAMTCFTSPSPRTSLESTIRLGDSASITDSSWAMMRSGPGCHVWTGRVSSSNWSCN